MNKNLIFAIFLSLTFLVFSFFGNAIAQDQPIGKILEMTGKVEVIRADGQKIEAKVDLEIYKDDQIRTGGSSAANIEFSDQTILTVFENSEITLSEFVYTPDTNQREGVIDLVKGQVRSTVGKTLSEDSSYKVKTRNSVMGIRGTTVLSKFNRRFFTPQTIHAVEDGMAFVGKNGQDPFTEGTPLSRGMMATFIGSKDPIIEMIDYNKIAKNSDLDEEEKEEMEKPEVKGEEEEVLEGPELVDPMGPDDKMDLEGPLGEPLEFEQPEPVEEPCPLYQGQ